MTLCRGKPPEVIALYHRFIELAQACGPFTCAVSKSASTLTGWPRPTRSEPAPTSATPHKTGPDTGPGY